MDRIIIKASLENSDEIRRFSVEKATFAQIYETIKQLFSVQDSAFAVQYKDPEGDLVVISNDVELIEALQVAKGSPLRVFIKLNPADTIPAKVDVSPVNEKQKEKVPELSNAPVDNSFFGAKRRAAEEQRPLWKDFPEILESRERVKAARQKLIAAREQIAAARKELVASRENFFSERKKLNDLRRVAHEKRQADKVVPEGPLKILARFVKHVTIPEDAELPPNTEFVKTWRFRNESNRPWPEARLLFVGKSVDDRLTDQNSFDVGSIAPGQEKDISIKMKTPALPGRYVSFWRLFDPASKAKFGQRVCARVNVVEKSPEEVDPDKKAFAGVLVQLQEMGFTDQEKNIRLIKRYDGNLSMVVQQLVKQLNESNGKQLRF